MQQHSDPCNGEGPCHGEGFFHHSVAERGHLAILGFAVAKLLFITHKIYVFCLSVFHPSKDLSIGLMRTL